MFVILSEVLLIQSQEEIHHLADWEGGIEGHQDCEQTLCEQVGVSIDLRKGPIKRFLDSVCKLSQTSVLFEASRDRTAEPH